jgi:hypothetical protein
MTAARTAGTAMDTKIAKNKVENDASITGIIHLLLLNKFFGFGIIVIFTTKRTLTEFCLRRGLFLFGSPIESFGHLYMQSLHLFF